MRSTREHVLVVGAGLAGLTCAWELAKAGANVAVVEAEPDVGGRAGRVRRADGKLVPKTPGMLSGSYTTLLRLVDELGLSDKLRWLPPALRFAGRGGLSTVDLSRGMFSLRTVLGMAMLDLLPLSSKLALSAACQPYVAGRASLGKEEARHSVASWAERRGLGERVVERFFGPICRTFSFAGPEEVAASSMLEALVEMAVHREAAASAFFDPDINASFFQPFVATLTEATVSVTTNSPVASLEVSRDTIITANTKDGPLRADAFVLAVPPKQVVCLLPPSLAEIEPFRSLRTIPEVPAVTVRLYLRGHSPRDVGLAFVPQKHVCAYVEAPGTARGHRELMCLLAPAHDLLTKREEKIIGICMNEIRDVLPEVEDADFAETSVVKFAEALISAKPGVHALRPHPRTEISNLFLAGDYVHTGVSPCLESAARSGIQTARAVMEHVGTG